MRSIHLYTCAMAAAVTIGSVAAEPIKKLRMVLPHPNIAVGEEVFLYAVPKRLGYFNDEGIELDVTTSAGSVAAGQILVTGGADVAPILAEAVLAIREQGGTPVAFYSLKRNNGFTVGVLPGSKIASLDDVSGKTIGFSSASSGANKMLAEQLRMDGKSPDYNALSLGTGPGVITAIRNGDVDALMLWDAVYALYENKGLKLDHYEIALQDKLAGYTMTANEAALASEKKAISGFCRAIAKGLHFTMTNPQAALQIFYEEYPSSVQADKDMKTNIAEGVNIMTKWLDRAQKGVAYGEKTGQEDASRWQFTQQLYTKFGQLKGTTDVSKAFTTDYFAACNDFDRAAVAAQAKAYVVR